MSDTAISIKNLSKMYKLYRRPFYKIMDLFHLNIWENSYHEFWALKDINLEVPKGTKIGIIGRNGAGKSTLLKIICGNVEPTTGKVRVNGRVSALLELGTGFHPEFSGKENVFASLAYQGITGKEAQSKYHEIIDFSELEEFIEQPLKTYSAGMYARLAFSVATVIKPEVLIIDEVLGAGDAYFTLKCVERMKALTSGGSTVLFVSHDMASVQRLCDIAVWIDRGRVLMNGDTLAVTKAYAASIREQEEIRLKAKDLKIQQNTLKSLLSETGVGKPVLFHLVNSEWVNPREKHPIHKITLYRNSEQIDEIRVGDAMDNDASQKSYIITSPGFIDWGRPVNLDSRYIRNFEDMKGQHGHAAFVMRLPHDAPYDDKSVYSISLDYKDISSEEVFIEAYNGGQYVRLGKLDALCDRKWKTNLYEMKKEVYLEKEDIIEDVYKLNGERIEKVLDKWTSNGDMQIIKVSAVEQYREGIKDVYGTGGVEILKVKIMDKHYKERRIFTVGDTMITRIHFKPLSVLEDPVFVMAIYSIDGIVVNQSISSKEGINFGRFDKESTVDVIFETLLIGRGRYIISVGIFPYVDLLSKTECPSFCIHDRKYEFMVEQPDGINIELGLVNHPVIWSRHDDR